jgi:alkanesulfonate monooxygenase SsuD/methylene tetrahydromethanopterin reductase-like flavin-dependent oxidoreductase (luciferase family)
MPVRFGLQVQAQRTTWADFLRALEATESSGYDSVYTFEHLLPFDGPDDGTAFETLTTVAAMAALTSRIRVGSLCNGVVYRDPATLTKAAVTIDHIAGRRYEFTLGPAWAEREFRAYGLPFPSPGERLRRLDEALTIIKSLWTNERSTVHGRYYTVDNAPCEPKPVQVPYPPIMIGGNRQGTMRLTLKHANSWNGIGAATFCADRIRDIALLCDEIGRDPRDIEYSASLELAIGGRHEVAEEAARKIAASHGRSLEDERGVWVIGTPAEVRQQVEAFVEAGVTHLIFAVASPFEFAPLELFAHEVIPAFRSL